MPTLKQLAVESLTHMVEGGQRRLAVDDDARDDGMYLKRAAEYA